MTLLPHIPLPLADAGVAIGVIFALIVIGSKIASAINDRRMDQSRKQLRQHMNANRGVETELDRELRELRQAQDRHAGRPQPPQLPQSSQRPMPSADASSRTRQQSGSTIAEQLFGVAATTGSVITNAKDVNRDTVRFRTESRDERQRQRDMQRQAERRGNEASARRAQQMEQAKRQQDAAARRAAPLTAAPTAATSVSKSRVNSPGDRLLQLMKTQNAKTLIIASEVLGKPVSMRDE